MCQVQPVGSLRVQLRLLSTVFLSVVLVYYAGSIIIQLINRRQILLRPRFINCFAKIAIHFSYRNIHLINCLLCK